MVLQRFVHDEWVPKKLEIEFEVPHSDNIDLERYRGNDGRAL